MQHTPVLLQPVIQQLEIRPGNKYIDATAGLGGHALQIVREGGEVLGIDRDQEVLKLLAKKVNQLPEKMQKIHLAQGNFSQIRDIAEKHGFAKVKGILFDLGISSWQLDKSGRGFSYRLEESLDMRVDKTQKLTAGKLLNQASEEELYEIFTKFGEEQHSRRIAAAIRGARPIKTTKKLGALVQASVPADPERTKARIFQALRIAVNQELENLRMGLKKALSLLEENAKILVISFHSLEDRIVKQNFKTWERQKRGKILTDKPIRPGREEIKKNRKASSAKLRVFAKQIQG